MNKKALITIGFAILCGIAAVYMVNHYMTAKEKDLYKGMELISVVAVNRDVNAGETITVKMLAKRQVPSKYVHGNAVDPANAELAIGQKLNFPLKKGDVLLWTDLGSEAERLNLQGLANSITEKERALSIEVDDVGGVSGHLQPNDHVDILCTVADRKTGEEATITLLQNITVLATGAPSSGKRAKAANYRTITLLVTLEEAEILVFADTKGTLTTVLRNPENIETVKDIRKVTFTDIFESELRRELQENRNTIEVIKKGKTAKE